MKREGMKNAKLVGHISHIRHIRYMRHIRNIKLIKYIVIIISAAALATFGIIQATAPAAPTASREIVISMPYSSQIRNIDTNYFKQWLEERTGLSIKFNIIYESLSPSYLRSMFNSGYVKSDALFSFFGDGDPDEINRALEELGEMGHIVPLNAFIGQSTFLAGITERYPEYDLISAMSSADGNIYYMPGYDPSTPESISQVLWLNQSWLKQLSLGIPRTTGDLRDVLHAFKTRDPNANGIADEIPLSGSRDVESEHSYDYIINAFIYNDPANSRFITESGGIRFAPATGEWRDAMKYLNGLYGDGLLSHFQFAMGHDSLAAMANDPRGILGGFASKSIIDVIYQSNPEIINDFIHIAPISAPGGAGGAVVRTPAPHPAGIITSSCEDPEAVFRLFDLMLSEEAFIIGRYGEEGVDWERAHISDMDSYGNRATIKVVNMLRNKAQNKHMREMGPFFAYPEYADGVTFMFEGSHEYINARAYRSYGQFWPAEYIRSIRFEMGAQENAAELRALRGRVDAHTDACIEAFTTGAADPFDDDAWESYLRAYDEIGLAKLIDAVQTSASIGYNIP